MPFWLMFVPIVAIGRAIATLFVALGQWITGNYFTLVPHDGGEPAHIEYIAPVPHEHSGRIRISLSDGRTYVALADSGTSGSPIERLAAEPFDEVFPEPRYEVAIRLNERQGGWMDCRLSLAERRAANAVAGTCVTDTGRAFDIVRNERPRPRAGLRRHG